MKYRLHKKTLWTYERSVFLSSPKIPSQPSLSTTRDDHLISILSQDNFTFKTQLRILTDYTIHLYDKNQDLFTSTASKIMSLYQYWLNIGFKIFSLQFNFLRPSRYDLKTDESDPSFLSLSQKTSHHQTYTKSLPNTKPQNYIFVNYRNTSPFNITHLNTIDHARITGYLRNYDLLYFCLLPYNDTSRPLFVPQEYLIPFDDFLLPCNILTQNVTPVTVIKHLVSSPLNDKDKSYYNALAKQSHSYNKLLFISAKIMSSMVQTKNKAEHKPPPIENTPPIRNTPGKLISS